MVSRKITLLLVVLLVLLLSACSPAGTQPGAIVTGAPEDLPAAALAAQGFISDSLGVEVSDVRIVSVEEVDWPDSCLGLGEANESCLAVITPGFNITLEVNGQSYEVHTDEQGVNIRQVQ